jgi:hypothetical protein
MVFNLQLLSLRPWPDPNVTMLDVGLTWSFNYFEAFQPENLCRLFYTLDLEIFDL